MSCRFRGLQRPYLLRGRPVAQEIQRARLHVQRTQPRIDIKLLREHGLHLLKRIGSAPAHEGDARCEDAVRWRSLWSCFAESLPREVGVARFQRRQRHALASFRCCAELRRGRLIQREGLGPASLG